MIKRILTFFSAAAVVLAALPSFIIPIEASSSTVWDGTSDTSWYNDTDTVFTISSAEQLAGLSYLVYSGNCFTGKTVNLSADVVLSTGDLSAPKGSGATQWTPIGGFVYHFDGTFDGQGHTVSGIYIDVFPDYQGLFGISDGTIKNVGVIDSYIAGTCFASGICAKNSGEIENCYFTGQTVGNNFICGICGYNEGTVKNCFSAGTANSANIGSGGICGYNLGVLIDCYNIGTVFGNNNVGGVCGCNNNSISNCYNIGTVSGIDHVGGVVGRLELASSSVSNCINIGKVSTNAKISSYVGGICGQDSGGSLSDCFYLGYDGGIGIAKTTDASDASEGTKPMISLNKSNLLAGGAQALVETFKNSLGADFNISVTKNGDGADIVITQNLLTPSGFSGEAQKLTCNVSELPSQTEKGGFTVSAAIGIGTLVLAAAVIFIFKKKLNK